MPKRLIDSSLLDSPSMEALSPAAQDAFPRFILLADDFGCFEINPDRLRANGWSKRPEVTVEHVAGWLHEYATKRAPGEPPVAMMWTERGRRYCHLTGWFGPRGQRKRAEYDATTEAGRKGSKRHTPRPPADLIASVMRGEVRASDGLPPGSDVFPPGNAAGQDIEKPNNSVPAREIALPAAVPPIPAYFPLTHYAVADAGTTPPHARVRLVSPFATGTDPHPATTAVLDALFARGIDAAPPADKSADRVEAAVVAATVPVAVERLAVVLADPNAKRPLTYHVEAIRGARPAPRREVGDLGCELRPWNTRLAPEEHAAAQAELAALAAQDPELDGAPLGIVGNPSSPAYEALRALNEKWRAVADAREGVA